MGEGHHPLPPSEEAGEILEGVHQHPEGGKSSGGARGAYRKDVLKPQNSKGSTVPLPAPPVVAEGRVLTLGGHGPLPEPNHLTEQKQG